jgi:hypothetical protein
MSQAWQELGNDDWTSLGPLGRSVAEDFRRLQASLWHLDPQQDVTQTVRNLRLSWPQEYLQPQDDADE